MKKKLGVCSMILALILLLSIPVLAFGSPDKDGVYDVQLEAAYTGLGYQVLKASGDAAIASQTAEIGGKAVAFFEEGARVRFTLSGLTAGSEQIIFGLNENATPTAANIQYIDEQTVGADGTVTFTIYPKELSGTVYVKLSNSDGLREVMRFSYYLTGPDYKLGDVDGDDDVTSGDALLVLKHVVSLEELTGKSFKAADVDKDGSITSSDALHILKAVVGIEALS